MTRFEHQAHLSVNAFHRAYQALHIHELKVYAASEQTLTCLTKACSEQVDT